MCDDLSLVLGYHKAKSRRGQNLPSENFPFLEIPTYSFNLVSSNPRPYSLHLCKFCPPQGNWANLTFSFNSATLPAFF